MTPGGGEEHRKLMSPKLTSACVLGTTDLVRPLGLAGLRCAVVAKPGAPVRYSRFVTAAFDWPQPWTDSEGLIDELVRWGKAQPEAPVLFYQLNDHLKFVSDHRAELSEAYRFVIAETHQVDDLLDKTRFARLAERLDLPVPSTVVLSPSARSSPPGDISFPVIIKPAMFCDDRWESIGRSRGKAMRIDGPDELRDAWPRLAVLGQDVVAQEVIPGPETLVESYHVYVDDHGEIVADFTGKKIRTKPREYGYSTAVTITDAHDVSTLGRALVRRLRLRGVSKFDFKRAPDGTLKLLEVNPRFNLWHHPGALAGVNLPLLVWTDLTGRPRPEVRRARANVRWCSLKDATAAREAGVSLVRWVPWALSCDATYPLAWDDPMPVIKSAVWVVFHRLPRRRSLAAPSGAKDEFDELAPES